jgi:hypothetical protein
MQNLEQNNTMENNVNFYTLTEALAKIMADTNLAAFNYNSINSQKDYIWYDSNKQSVKWNNGDNFVVNPFYNKWRISEKPSQLKYFITPNSNSTKNVFKLSENDETLAINLKFNTVCSNAKDLKKEFIAKYPLDFFQPFDKVLVRNSNNGQWKCEFFNSITDALTYRFKCVGKNYVQCIPYNKDTYKLIDTNEKPNDFYINW